MKTVNDNKWPVHDWVNYEPKQVVWLPYALSAVVVMTFASWVL